MKNSARLIARLAPAIALAAAAMPAHAQVTSGSYRSMTKTEAILGGAPSALAAITSQQGGRPAYSSFVVPGSGNPYLRPAVAAYSPKSFSSAAISNVPRESCA